MSPTQSANQPQSTGPRTPEGKKRSSMNALRHGLTGRVVVLPSEDMDAYHAFCKELMADLAPETPLERQYAQDFCDTHWRLNRVRSIEDSMLALGHFEPAGDIEVNHPEVHAALTAARVFRADSKSFVNLSLYEQRLQRVLKESLRQLRELQAERKAAESHKTEAPPAKAIAHATTREFVFSTIEIEPENRGQQAPTDVQNPSLPLTPAA